MTGSLNFWSDLELVVSNLIYTNLDKKVGRNAYAMPSSGVGSPPEVQVANLARKGRWTE